MTAVRKVSSGNLLRQFTYAPSGQVIGDIRKENDIVTDTYAYGLNGRGRMTSVTLNGAAVADYTYDISEQRIIKALPSADPIHYHYDGKGRLIAEADGMTGE